MTPQQYDYLLRLKIAVNENHQSLNNFEQNFTESFFEKLDTYGIKTFVSDKQWNVLSKLADKLSVEIDNSYED